MAKNFRFVPRIDPNFKLPSIDPEELKQNESLNIFIEEVKEQGRQEERLRIAKRMLANEVSEIQIADLTHLCLSAIEKLK